VCTLTCTTPDATYNHSQIIAFIKSEQEERPLPESELVHCIWQGLMASVDWSARPDQIEALALREVTVTSPSRSPPIHPELRRDRLVEVCPDH
jgi:hypothetical protein